MDSIERITPSRSPAPSTPNSPPAALPALEWISPGVSRRKRWLTGAGVLLASVVFFWIALSEGATMLVSTVIGIVFIGGFVGYLRVVAPTPFTITLDAHALSRTEPGGEPQVIPWEGIAKIKEELFPNRKPVSITVYKRVGARGLHRAWVAYGDDLPRFEALIAALRERLPEGTPWICETVHE